MTKSLKTKRRRAEKKRPPYIPPPRRGAGLTPARAAGEGWDVDSLVERIRQVCAERRSRPFDAGLGRLEMKLRSELRGLGFSERELCISPRQLGTNPRALRIARLVLGGAP